MRKKTDFHLQNECDEQLLDCINDDCKEQVKRKRFENHINNECESRIVECKFKIYGCDIGKIKACEIQQHLDCYKFDHLAKKFDFITNQVWISTSCYIHLLYSLIYIQYIAP